MIGPEAVALRVGLQLELCVCDEQHPFEQVVEVLARLGRDVGELRRSTPLLGLEALRDELLAGPRRVRLRLVDLVHRDDDRHAGCPRVADRLLRLRLHAVVRSHDENGDVGDLRATRPERRERLVTGRVEEGDPPSVVIDLVGADVLRDPAGLGLDDRALADCVEQRRLPVVDVAHDRDDGRPVGEVLLVVLEDLVLEVLLVGVLDLDLALELSSR